MDIDLQFLKMQQKVELLEQEMQRVNIDIADKAVKRICSLINESSFQYLPRLSKKIQDLKKGQDDIYKQMMEGFAVRQKS